MENNLKAILDVLGTVFEQAEKRGHKEATFGAGVGGLAGGVLGSFLGPLGAIAGAGIGAGLGNLIGGEKDEDS